MVEKPGALGGFVGAPSPKLLPDGYALAADFAALRYPSAKLAGKKLKVKGKKKVKAKVSCPARFEACNDGTVVLTKGKQSPDREAAKPKRFKVAKGKFDSIDGGSTKSVKLKLTDKARKYLRTHKKIKVTAELTIAEVVEPTTQKAQVIGKKKRR